MTAFVTLARWLGPWADPTKLPDVERVDGALAGIHTRRYGAPGGRTFLIAPGLHYAGADDPRMDRFCRVLATAGHRVIAPFLPSFLALTPDAQAVIDFRRVAEELDEPAAVFSISFGSLLAFALAAERPEIVERLVIFGGYADFHDTMRFCLTGEVAGVSRTASRDPLNQPVVLMNLLDHIDHDPAQRAALVAGWLRYVERVWGRPEMKRDRAFAAIAEEIAPSVPESVRELFRIGTGVLPGAWQVAEPALAKFDGRALDPLPYLARLRGRVDLVHGADDDVIPFEQAHALAAQLVHADVATHITGLYGHTGASVGRLRALPRELVTMLRVLRVLAL